MKNQDIILELFWLKYTNTFIDPEIPSLYFKNQGITMKSSYSHVNVQQISAAAFNL
jgi:hypothetical protein